MTVPVTAAPVVSVHVVKAPPSSARSRTTADSSTTVRRPPGCSTVGGLGDAGAARSDSTSRRFCTVPARPMRRTAVPTASAAVITKSFWPPPSPARGSRTPVGRRPAVVRSSTGPPARAVQVSRSALIRSTPRRGVCGYGAVVPVSLTRNVAARPAVSAARRRRACHHGTTVNPSTAIAPSSSGHSTSMLHTVGVDDVECA
jgi:hypothetical protein